MHAMMRFPPLRLLLALLALLPACIAPAARADTAIAQYQTFRGNVNFTGTEGTLRSSATSACSLSNNSYGIYAYLGGLPNGATVLSAQLYWAGSGSTPDYAVTFDGVAKTATRKYTSATIGNGYNYFGGAVDVTKQVSTKGNGYYFFNDLQVNAGNPWCASQGVVGGFALLVIYSHPNEASRILNLYEGFQYIRNSSLTINLTNFRVPSPLPDASTGRVGHITWEGDSTLSQGGEDLLFNGYALTDSMNPSGNQFNSQSSINGDANSYGIDFDAYVLKPPVIKAGDSSATTTYRSGADLVLLNAEVVAMPFITTADLAVAMTRSGELRVGSTATYTITVTNNGPDAEAGPVTVVDTLPKGLKLVSTAGSGWSCSNVAQTNGPTTVTCTQNGPVAANTTMAPLVLTVSPTTAGSFSNDVTVSGKTYDNNAANNSARETATATDQGSVSFVFTSRACNPGEAIVYVPGEAGCPAFAGPITAAQSTGLMLTAVSGTSTLKAAPLSTTQTVSRSLQFSAACLPNSGVPVSYGGYEQPCDGTLSPAVSVEFGANKPSAILAGSSAQFTYNDVGRLVLSMKYNNVTSASSPIYSRPSDVRFMKIVRDSDKYPDLNVDASNVSLDALSSLPDLAFAKAGETFWMYVGAMMANGKWAPSFGKEQAALAKDMPGAFPLKVALDFDESQGDKASFAVTDNFTQSGTDAASGGGVLVGAARYDEAGMLRLKIGLVDYLGTGEVQGTDAVSKRWVGRFYPDHFTTDIGKNFDCLDAMACPVMDADKPAYGVDGATYSQQPFSVTVKAFGLGGADAVLGRYANVAHKQTDAAYTQPIATTIVLGGYRQPVSTTDNLGTAAPLDRDNKADFSGFKVTTALPVGAQTGTDGKAVPFPDLQANALYQLKTEYKFSDARGMTSYSKPTPVYVRASAFDTRRRIVNGKDVQERFEISSITAAGGPQYEDGIMVVAGRTLVANVFGSELLRVPVPLLAQYWTGSAWKTSENDPGSTVAAAIAIDACTRSFGGAGACKTDLLKPVDAKGVTLGSGDFGAAKGRLILRAPGRGVNGSVDFRVTGGAAENWLPSTKARASFGLSISPLIYIREVY